MGATAVEKSQSEKENINIFLPKREHVSGRIPQGSVPGSALLSLFLDSLHDETGTRVHKFCTDAMEILQRASF